MTTNSRKWKTKGNTNLDNEDKNQWRIDFSIFLIHNL